MSDIRSIDSLIRSKVIADGQMDTPQQRGLYWEAMGSRRAPTSDAIGFLVIICVVFAILWEIIVAIGRAVRPQPQPVNIAPNDEDDSDYWREFVGRHEGS